LLRLLIFCVLRNKINFCRFLASFFLVFDVQNLYRATRVVIIIVLFILQCTCTFNSKLPKGVILCAIWAGRNTQSATFCALAGDGLVCGCYQIYPENAQTIRYDVIVKRKVLIFFSQSTCR